jgi:hypothetical protein
MDNYDEGVSSSSQNGDILESDDEKEKEHSSEEESNSEEDDSKEESEDGEHESSEDGEDYDPRQTLISEEKLQLLEQFQENVESLNNEGFSEDEAKRQSFSGLLPKLTMAMDVTHEKRSKSQEDRADKR